MPTIEIEGFGDVEVGDEFLKLTPEQQNQTVDEIAATLRSSKKVEGSDPSQQPADKPRGLFALSPAFEHGLTFGLSDELAGLAGALGPKGIVRAVKEGSFAPIGDAYSARQKEEQARIDQYRRENPNWSMVQEILGGLVTGGARAGVPGPTTRLGTYGQAVKEGAGLGAVAGFGYSDQSLEDKAKGTLAGAGVGAATGVVLPALADTGRLAAGAWNRLTGGNPESRAINALEEALRADSVTPDRARTRLGTLGEQATIADAGGVKTRSLVREATAKGNLGNTVNTRLDQRQAGAAGRIMDSVRRTLSSTDDAAQTIDDLARDRSTRADPLYRDAYSRPIESPTNLNVLLRNPHMERAWSRAQDLINLERDTARARYARALLDGDDAAAAEANQILRLPDLYTTARDGARAINPKAVETTQVWDYVKRALDDEIAAKMRVDQFGRQQPTNESRLLGNLRREMLTEVDRQNPAFARARATFAGDTDTIDAVELGRRFYQGDANVTLREIEALPESQKEFFRVGVADAIRQRIEGTRATHNAGMRIFGTPDQMRRLRAAFPQGPEGNRAFREFQQTVIAEARKMRTRRIVPAEAGSQTQLRQQAAADASGFGTAALDVASGNNLGIVRRLLVGDGMPQEVADEILKRALNVDRPANLPPVEGARTNEQTLREIERLLESEEYWGGVGPQVRQMLMSGGLTGAGALVSGQR